jgi:membrane protein implicated in regulation of membrane protease activity
MRGAGTFRHVFGVPAVLAVIGGIGLMAALLGDGPWDALSWLALGTLVAVILRHWMKPRRTQG